MVRRSSTTSRGTTYWFLCFCFPLSGYFVCARARSPERMCLPKNYEKINLGNEGNDKVMVQYGSGLKAKNTLGTRLRKCQTGTETSLEK